nr:uncharacterized protein LOC100185033 isoform X1 [Ciona intestinalis]|eukprot:XP_026689565.1 uncharacterized protein LOC100185033 isoform X1 [Ciona intestinalis]
MAGVAEVSSRIVGNSAIDGFGLHQPANDAYLGRPEYQATARGHSSDGSEQRDEIGQVFWNQVSRDEKGDRLIDSYTAIKRPVIDPKEFKDLPNSVEPFTGYHSQADSDQTRDVSSPNGRNFVYDGGVAGVQTDGKETKRFSQTAQSCTNAANGNSNNNTQRKRGNLGLPPHRQTGYQKPPILSPKPFIAKKPRRLSDTSASEPPKRVPNPKNEQGEHVESQNVFQFGSRVIRRVSAPSVVYKAKLTELKVVTPELIAHSTEATEKRKNFSSCDSGISTTPKACLPRIRASEQHNSSSDHSGLLDGNKNREIAPDHHRGLNMDFKAKQQLISNILPDPARIPPKVASKPKNRPPALHLSPGKVNGENQFKNEPRTDELAIAPVSAKRDRFEQMQMAFKKPMPDPVFKPPQPENHWNSNGPLSPTANELFKDILEMKDIESFGETVQIQQSKQEPTRPTTKSDKQKPEKVAKPDYSYMTNDWSLEQDDSRKINVEGGQNMKDLKAKYEHEFDRKLINSLISPTEKKNFFKGFEVEAPGHARSASHGERVKAISPPRKLSDSSVQDISNKFGSLPRNMHNKKQNHFCDGQDFPPLPLNLPPPPDPPVEQTPHDSHTNEAEAPRFPVYPSAGEGSYTKQRSDNPSHSLCSVTTGPVDARAALTNYPIREPEGVARNFGEVSSQPTVAKDCNVGQGTGGPSQDISNSDSVSSKNTTAPRDIDDEILYYDNMDIMEKVRQKREQDEKRMAKVIARESARNPEIPEVSQRGISRSSTNQKNNGAQQARIECVSVDSNRKQQITVGLKPSPDKRRNQSASQGDINANISTEFRSALGELEYEYKKLKENLDQQMDLVDAAAPPKLPPKQKKLVRNTTDSQQQQKQHNYSGHQVPQTNGNAKQVQAPNKQLSPQLKLQIPVTNQQITHQGHAPSPMPQFYQAQANFQQPAPSQASAAKPSHNPAQNLNHPKPVQSSSNQQILTSALLQQNALLSVEESRARSIVDEPLAPIIEEDSTYGDSSSCASSVTGDDLSIYTDDCSIDTRQRSSSPSCGAWSFASSQAALNGELDNDGETTETEAETTTSQRESGSTTVHSTSSNDDASDASSVRWQQSPITSKVNRQSSNEKLLVKPEERINTNKSASTVKNAKPSNEDGDYEFISDTEDTGSHSVQSGLNRAASVESKVSCSSAGASSIGRSGDLIKADPHEEEDVTVHDVEPYGMVDLSKLEPSFEQATPVQSRKYKVKDSSNDNELTPSSIMNSVNEFFGTLPKKKQKQVETGSPTEEETPHFPLDIPPTQAPPTPKYSRSSKSTTVTTSRLQRSKSDATRELKVPAGYEEVGYDNLENYGGEARKAAEAKRAQSVRQEKHSKHSPGQKKTSEHKRNQSFDSAEEDTSRSRDSLASTPGLTQQTAGSRASFPLPVSASRLARHSSAVSALDRHSGNLKRSKQSNTASVKSPSSRRIEQRAKVQPVQQQQSSTLPRLRTDRNENLGKPSFDHTSKSTENFASLDKEKTHREHIKQEEAAARERKISRESLKNRTNSRECALDRQSSQENEVTTKDQGRRYDRSGGVEHKLSTHRSNSKNSAPATPEDRPFPVFNSDYDESLDDGVVNPYEEVEFTLDASHTVSYQPKIETEEQVEAKHRVQEILDNIQPPESPYKPKPPLPRYPVEYDNFYLGSTGETKSRASSGIGTDEAGRSKIGSGATSSSSPPPSPSTEEPSRTSGYSEGALTPVSTPASVRSSRFPEDSGTDATLPFDEREQAELRSPRRKSRDESRNGEDSSDAAPNRSLGSQLRSLLGGSPESKYISPSLRRKRSLLKRSKSPGGSRRSKTPPRSKSPSKDNDGKSELESVASTPALPRKEERQSQRSSKIDKRGSKANTPVPNKEEEDPVILRSASQRIVDRRGRSGSSSARKAKSSDQESEPSELGKDRKLRMSSRWRRSKSSDRSPTRSKSKERSKFGKRSKSQERPPPKGLETKEIDIEGGEERGGRSIFRRSRSSSRKRDKRGKSTERKEEGATRGRNPVSFFRKLLRNKKDEDEGGIVHVPLGKGVDMSDSTEALSTILAYKGDEVSEPEQWTPPRPHPPQQRITKPNQKSSPTKPKERKAMRSPPSHRAKKMSSSISSRGQADHSTESSSEGVGTAGRTKNNRNLDTYGNLGINRANLGAPQKPARPSSRKSSFSNSLPSSDSERQTNAEASNTKLKSSRVYQTQHGVPVLRRPLLREYDSDTPTSALASDADSSTGVASDAETGGPLRSAIKQGPLARLKGTLRGSPRRPVRVVSPRRSKSDPTIFDGDSTVSIKNTYYNLETQETTKTPPASQEKKSKLAAQQRRRSQKQSRRQTAPVDLAYATHQRQKYRTLVSLNAQTLRKVTERWLAEWRNQLPVGGFLITSWSDVAIESHRPICMIGNSVVYPAVSTGNNKFNLACQLYDQRDVGERMILKLENSSSLPAHPNTCGVCSHFPCRVPRSLLDPTSGGGAADALCVVLSTRPSHSLQEYLDRLISKEEPTEYHRQVLIALLQLLQGIKHLLASGFDLPCISAEHLVITEDRGFLQILPHLNWSDSVDSKRNRLDVDKVLDAYQSSDSDSNQNSRRLSHTQQLAALMKRLLQNANLASSSAGMGRPGDRSSAASLVSRVVVPGTKYSTAIKHIVYYLERSPPVGAQEAAELVQCALWGPEDLEDVGVDDVTPFAALELWIEMEQAKLVNSLAVLNPGDRMVPVSFLKHQYFSTVTPEMLFNGLKTLQRI